MARVKSEGFSRMNLTTANSYNLYIFFTSEVPDVYINTIGYCVDHYTIGKIVLLGVIKDKGQRVSEEKKLERIKERVCRQLSLLQEGKYLFKDQRTSQWVEREILIAPHHRARYARIAEKRIESYVFTYDILNEQINDFLLEGNNHCIFDVSATLKGLLIDTYTILRSKGIKSIHVFELQKERVYNESELIHNLYLDRKDYEFVNLTESDYTKGTIIKTFEQEQFDTIRAQGFERAVKLLADQYANNILLLYSLLVIASIIVFVILVVQGNWSNLEPWTFVLLGPPLIYLFELIAQIFFKRDFSIKPSLIHDWLKIRRLGQLSKDFKIDIGN